MTATSSYLQRRQQLTTYFDRTAAAAWERLTSDAPVGRIRATVRAGRDRMRASLLEWLPEDMTGQTLLDAGCGTGALATAVAHRGGRVTAIDLSPTLVDIARERCTADGVAAAIDFRVGDMLDPALGQFDHVVAMDSLIHYEPDDLVRAVAALAAMAQARVLFTFAPRTPALALMHAVGRLAPQREHRAPSIVPVAERALRDRLHGARGLGTWQVARTQRVANGFYISQAQELRPA